MHLQQSTHRHRARGFTLTEAAVLIAGIGLGLALLGPTLGSWRTDARLAGSRDNLRQLGEAHAAYSAANSGFIAGFDWRGRPETGGFDPNPSPEYDIGCGSRPSANDNLEAAQIQIAAIIRKATGRCRGSTSTGKIIVNRDRVPHYRYGLAPLFDWLGASPTDPIVVSPMDTHQQDFQTIVTTDRYPDLPGGNAETSFGGWQSSTVVSYWTYASSYQTTTYAFSPSRPDQSGSLALAPAGDATQYQVNSVRGIGPQLHQDVRFPANKALLFEEFDYSQGLGNQGRYYADPLASVNVLAFDGSAPRVATADANPGWDPEHFTDMERAAELRYHSIDTRYFPDDSERPDAYGGYYKWTRGGLEGIDFGAGEINTSDW